MISSFKANAVAAAAAAVAAVAAATTTAPVQAEEKQAATVAVLKQARILPVILVTLKGAVVGVQAAGLSLQTAAVVATVTAAKAVLALMQ